MTQLRAAAMSCVVCFSEREMSICKGNHHNVIKECSKAQCPHGVNLFFPLNLENATTEYTYKQISPLALAFQYHVWRKSSIYTFPSPRLTSPLCFALKIIHIWVSLGQCNHMYKYDVSCMIK
jgi:hypothetical protein